MALDQLVWTFNDSLYTPMRLGYKVFVDYGQGDLRFENNPQTSFDRSVTRGVFMRANEGKSGVNDIRVDEDTQTKYRTGFHVFARKKGLNSRIKYSASKVIVPVIYSGLSALGAQYNQPVVIAQAMYVPKPEEVETLSKGLVTESMRRAINAEIGHNWDIKNLKRVKRFDYRPYVSPAFAEKINELVLKVKV